MTGAHVLYIPLVLGVGIFLGWSMARRVEEIRARTRAEALAGIPPAGAQVTTSPAGRTDEPPQEVR